MAVDRNMVERVASLARLKLGEGEADALVGELSAILSWVEQLGEVDVTGVAPMSAVIPKRMALREDVVTEGNDRAAVLANAPVAEAGFFAVPKVIE